MFHSDVLETNYLREIPKATRYCAVYRILHSLKCVDCAITVYATSVRCVAGVEQITVSAPIFLPGCLPTVCVA